MQKKKIVEKLIERPVLEDGGSTLLKRSELAVHLGVSENTVREYENRGKLENIGFMPKRQPGNRVLYADVREASRNAFIDPNDTANVRESAPGNRKNRVADDEARGGLARVKKFDPDTGKPVTRYEPHLTDSKGRRVAHNARTAATSSKDDDNPRFVSLSRTPMTHFALKGDKLHCPHNPLHGTSLDELKEMSVHGVVHNNQHVPLAVGKAQEPVREAYEQATIDGLDNTVKPRKSKHSALKEAFEKSDKAAGNSGLIVGLGSEDGDENESNLDTMGRI